MSVAPFLATDVDGKWTGIVGQTWRRRGDNGEWEYRQDEETDTEHESRAW
jgi:hypothetical protein